MLRSLYYGSYSSLDCLKKNKNLILNSQIIAIVNDNEPNADVFVEPKIVIKMAIIFTLVYLNKKFRQNGKDNSKSCKTCQTKHFEYYQIKKYIVCVERFNYFFFIFFPGFG